MEEREDRRGSLGRSATVSEYRREKERVFFRKLLTVWLGGSSVGVCVCGSCKMRVENQGPDQNRKQLKDFECGRDVCFRKTTLTIVYNLHASKKLTAD